jgi:GcrA cell cycle regulator
VVATLSPHLTVVTCGLPPARAVAWPATPAPSRFDKASIAAVACGYSGKWGVQMDAGAVTETTDPDCTVIPRMGSSWTEERVATVKRMVTENYTASQIAAELGGVSRNAVIGIMHRRKFSAVNAKRRRMKVRGRNGAFGVGLETQDSVPLPEINPLEDFDIAPAQRRTLLELTNTTCRWPVGDPASPEFFFCGAPGADCDIGRSYCALHARRAYYASGKAAGSMRWAAARATYQSPHHL